MQVISCFDWLHGEKNTRRIQLGTTEENLEGVRLIVATNFPHCHVVWPPMFLLHPVLTSWTKLGERACAQEQPPAMP